MTSDIEWLEDKDNWSGLKCIGMVESTREIKGECSQEKLNAALDPKYLEEVMFG